MSEEAVATDIDERPPKPRVQEFPESELIPPGKSAGVYFKLRAPARIMNATVEEGGRIARILVLKDNLTLPEGETWEDRLLTLMSAKGLKGEDATYPSGAYVTLTVENLTEEPRKFSPSIVLVDMGPLPKEKKAKGPKSRDIEKKPPKSHEKHMRPVAPKDKTAAVMPGQNPAVSLTV